MGALQLLAAIRLTVSGARGKSFSDIARQTGAFGTVPQDNDAAVLSRFANYAITQNPGFQSTIPGPSNNTRLTLAALKAAAISDKTSLYDRSLWTWETADAPYVADDINVVKANSTPLATGAWVRQSAQGSTFKASGTGAVLRSMQDKARETISAKDFGFGASGNSAADNKACFNRLIAVQQAVGGEIKLPSGFYVTEPLTVALTTGTPLVIRGDGQLASVIRKPANSSDPVLTISSTTNLFGYTTLDGICLDNGFRSRAGTALKLIDLPRFQLERCRFEGCATGIRGEGALIGSLLECSALNNGVGYDFTKSAANVYANLLTIERGEIRGNDIGLRLDYGIDLSIDRVDIEFNGLTGNPATGAILFGNNLTGESGTGSLSVRAWFEGNKGVTIKGVNPGNAATIVLDRSFFVNNENVGSGEVQLTGWSVIKLISVLAANGTWTTQATDFDTDLGSFIHTLNDTSTAGPRDLRTSAQRFENSMSLARVRAKAFPIGTQDLLLASGNQIIPGDATKNVGLGKYGDGELWLGTTGAKRIRMDQAGLGFYGANPIGRPNTAAVATDAASTQALANSLRSILIALGLAG